MVCDRSIKRSLVLWLAGAERISKAPSNGNERKGMEGEWNDKERANDRSQL